MKKLIIVTVAILFSIFLFENTPYADVGSEVLYVGLPSKPLPDDRDEGNNDGEAADEGYDSAGDEGRRDKKQGNRDKKEKRNNKDREDQKDQDESEGFDRYEDWYEPDPSYN